MIREHLFHKRAPADPLFRWRGAEVSRLEAFSDGIFAVVLTLLIVSVTVPTTFYELWTTVRDLPVFLVSFAMLMMAWYYHYQFFRRYGLEDFLTTILNAAFLFLILFFAYPLKFLAAFLWSLVLGIDPGPMFAIPEGVPWAHGEMFQRIWMMYFYGFGIVGVFGLLALMVWVALRKRGILELDALEVYLTKRALLHHLITVGVALLSISVLLVWGDPGLAGVTYFLMGPLHGGVGWWGGVQAEKIHQSLLKKASANLAP